MQELFSKFPGGTPNDLIAIYWVTIGPIGRQPARKWAKNYSMGEIEKSRTIFNYFPGVDYPKNRIMFREKVLICA